jgi:glycosyltransferase involved in cell wall biosynthesis
MKPRLHILHTERYIKNQTLIESAVVRNEFRLTKSHRLDLHAQLVYTQTYAASDILHALRHCQIPYIVHMGGDIWYELTEDPHRLAAVNQMLRQATLIVANSSFLYRIITAYGFKNAMFLPGGLWGFDESVHGVMPQRFNPRRTHEASPRMFLMNISLKVWKKYQGIERFMRHTHRYLRSIDAEVICAGGTADASFANRMSSEYGVHFVGKRTDWPSYLPQADVFLHPSMFDCFPRALAESKCAGVPALSFRVAGNVEVGDSPIYVDPSSEDEIVGALRALEDRSLREYLGWLGRERALEKTVRHRGDYPTIFKVVLEGGAQRLIQGCREALA